ncbi:hypothetical protein [Burkholderia sp. BCC1047]|uniref:hypothetical protein n=1 Tax=Burkholderia sp. BCC1047 TaxID=2676299 RepID=UPI00158954F2|nr:hypothetical protein [Burkholderia sp. BCC1047]
MTTTPLFLPMVGVADSRAGRKRGVNGIVQNDLQSYTDPVNFIAYIDRTLS